MAQRRANKSPSTKSMVNQVWNEDGSCVVIGDLKRGRGRPGKISPLFSCIAEKLPYGSLDAVQTRVKKERLPATGVYIAHDSMGTARYIGRGNIFNRLRRHKYAHVKELHYYSFFVVRDKVHEREVETLLIRAAGDSLTFNERKKRVGVMPGNVRDYEAGTKFFERQIKRGRPKG